MSYGKFLLIFLFSVISFDVFSQSSSIISGYIKDGNETTTGATVIVKGSQIGATSNEQGYYELVDVKPGVCTLTVSYLGYLKESKTITLNINQNLSLSFSLKKDQQQL